MLVEIGVHGSRNSQNASHDAQDGGNDLVVNFWDGTLRCAADDDAGSGGDHGSGGRGLGTNDAVAGEIHVEASSGCLLNDLAYGEADERGDFELRLVIDGDGGGDWRG